MTLTDDDLYIAAQNLATEPYRFIVNYDVPASAVGRQVRFAIQNGRDRYAVAREYGARFLCGATVRELWRL